jgi:hypothetical protein
MFTAPASSDFIGPKELLGHLLIVRPIEHVEGVKTQYGLKDGIRVDIAVLTARDNTGQPLVYEGVTWLSSKLIASLKKTLGQLVLGRMSQGAAKPGQEPAWELVDAMTDPQAVAAATAFIAAHPEFASRTTPVSAAAAVAPVQPVQQPAAVPAAIIPVQSLPTQPVAVPVAAQMASAPSGGIDPAVWAALPEDTRTQLIAAGARPAGA